MYGGFGDLYKAKRIDNRLHELGHAGQTNTGASCAGKPDSRPEGTVLINLMSAVVFSFLNIENPSCKLL